jgi:hypothetical protein
MTTFEIYFHGLICFYANEPRHGNFLAPKTHALFVRDDDHYRSLVTSDGLIHAMGFNSLSMSVNDGAPQGVIATTDRFQNDVPHLSDDTHSRRGIYVDPTMAIPLAFPSVAGVLDVAQRYKYAANYLLGQSNTTRATARICVLSFEANSLTLSWDGLQVEVSPQKPWVLLLNSSDHGGVSTVEDVCANHFRRYSKIMRNVAPGVNCSTVAEVIDLESQEVEDTPNGTYVEEVKKLLVLKPEAEVRIPVPPKPDPGTPGYRLYTARIGHNFDIGPDVLAQTQCSNSNWP